MPIYEYECKQCGHQLEAFQKMSEAPLTMCPVCEKPALSKLISSTSFQLKGTGWYATDFRNKGKPEETKKSTTTPAAKVETEAKKTDSSPPPASSTDKT